MKAYGYYQSEREEFLEEFYLKLPSSKATESVIKKLLRHFKVGDGVKIEFTSGRNHSHAGKWVVRINVEQNNFAVICHEVAHTYQARREGFERGDHWHTKKHRRIMKRMLNYCKKKDYWGLTEST